jgi:hypothetical protein
MPNQPETSKSAEKSSAVVYQVQSAQPMRLR